MEQLELTPSKNPEIYLRGRSMELAMLQKKVIIKLTGEQLKTLVHIMTHYIYNHSMITLGEKATIALLVKIEGKNRQKMFLPKKSFTLSLDIPSALAIFQMFIDLDFSGFPYERTLCDLITGEIDHQTV